MNLPGDTKVGFKWDNNSNAYELVTDLDLWKFEIPVKDLFLKLLKCMLIKQLFQNKRGWLSNVEAKNKNDGSIELVLTKWDN